jgi:outer membrane protein assembly factor BamB
MPMNCDAINVGIRGTVLALDRRTGAETWRAVLKGKEFVSVVLDGEQILAATLGELFCLDAATGRILWNNELRGLGRDVITVACRVGATAPEAAMPTG